MPEKVEVKSGLVSAAVEEIKKAIIQPYGK